MADFLTELREELLDGLERYERAPRWRRLPRLATARRLAVAALAGAAAFAGVQILGSSQDAEDIAAPQVSRLEGFHASAGVMAYGSLWVTQYNVSSLDRIDPRTGKVLAHIDVGGSPGAVHPGDGAIWVMDWERGRVVKVDPATNRVVGVAGSGGIDGDLAFADGAVWTAGSRAVLMRIDPDRLTVTRRVPLGVPAATRNGPPVSPGLAPAGDTMWVVVGADVVQVDMRSGDIIGRARSPMLMPEFARRTAADPSGLWISSPTRRELIHIDARTRHVTRFPLRGDPGPVALIDGRVWVGTVHNSGALTRVTVLEKDSGRVVGSLPLPFTAVNIIPSAGGGAWVTFGEDGTKSPAALRLVGP